MFGVPRLDASFLQGCLTPLWKTTCIRDTLSQRALWCSLTFGDTILLRNTLASTNHNDEAGGSATIRLYTPIQVISNLKGSWETRRNRTLIMCLALDAENVRK